MLMAGTLSDIKIDVIDTRYQIQLQHQHQLKLNLISHGSCVVKDVRAFLAWAYPVDAAVGLALALAFCSFLLALAPFHFYLGAWLLWLL